MVGKKGAVSLETSSPVVTGHVATIHHQEKGGRITWVGPNQGPVLVDMKEPKCMGLIGLE